MAGSPKREERNLQDSGIYRILFEASPHAMIIVDPETLLPVEFNDAAPKLLGCYPEEFAAIPLNEYDTNNHSRQMESLIKEVLRIGRGSYEAECETRSGKRIYCQVHMQRVTIRGRQNVYAVIRDTTEQNRAEIRLQKSESQYRSLIENSPDIIMEIDPNGSILFANRVLKGVSIDEAIGTSLLDYIPKNQHSKVRKAMHKSLVRGRNTAFEISLITPEGKRWWSTRVLPLERDGKTDRFLLIITDITTAKRAEEALRISEERYRSLVENAPIPILISRKGKFLYLNPEAVKLVGAAGQDELIGESSVGMIVPGDREDVEESIAAGYRSPGDDDVSSSELRFRRKDGEFRDAIVSAITVKYEGKLARLAIIEDVTERQRAEEALKESEQKFRYITENMRDAVFMMDLNFKHTYISPAITHIRGFTTDEIYALPIEQSLTPAALEQATMLLSEGLEKGELGPDGLPKVYEFEQEEYCKDGSTVWTEVRATLMYDDDGEPIGIMGITRDISERRRAAEERKRNEEQFGNLIENSPLPIIVYSNKKLIYANSMILKLIGAREAGEVLDRSIFDFLHEDSHSLVNAHLRVLEEDPYKVLREKIKLNTPGGPLDVELTGMTVEFYGEQARMIIMRPVENHGQNNRSV